MTNDRGCKLKSSENYFSTYYTTSSFKELLDFLMNKCAKNVGGDQYADVIIVEQ